jgi:hypothetical protein
MILIHFKTVTAELRRTYTRAVPTALKHKNDAADLRRCPSARGAGGGQIWRRRRRALERDVIEVGAGHCVGIGRSAKAELDAGAGGAAHHAHDLVMVERVHSKEVDRDESVAGLNLQ